MKKISEWVDVIREAEKRELSKLQQSYQEYFLAKLKKFGVKSPADLSADKKSEFFGEITKDWEKGQGANESGKKDVQEYGLKEGNAFLAARAKALEEGAEEFEFNGKVYQVHNKGVNEEEIKKSDVKKMIQDETKDLEKKVKKAEDAAKDAEKKAEKAEDEANSATKDAEKAQDKAGKGEIKNKEDFSEYAMKILKKQHPKDFDEAIAKKVIDGLSKDAEKSGDWGAAIGRLNKG
jgi:hypothetical protein